jgi:hypothetical protein
MDTVDAEHPTVAVVLAPLLHGVGRDDLVATLVRDLDAGAVVTPSPATRADVTAGVRGVLVDLPAGSAELRWCPEAGLPWAVAVADDWAQPLVCSCGAATVFLDDAMLSLRLAARGSSGSLLRALARHCVLTRILAEDGVPPPAEDAVAAKVAELRDDAAAVGFGGQRLRDHATFTLQVDALRRSVVAAADPPPGGGLAEAWWVRLASRPPAVEADRLRSLPAGEARTAAETLLVDGALEGDVVVSRRARALLPAALRTADAGATVVEETGDGGLFCGGVLVDVPVDTHRLSPGTRRRLEQQVFDAWVDARPENADLQWHWEV